MKTIKIEINDGKFPEYKDRLTTVQVSSLDKNATRAARWDFFHELYKKFDKDDGTSEGIVYFLNKARQFQKNITIKVI